MPESARPPAQIWIGLIIIIFSLAAVLVLKTLLEIYALHFSARHWEKIPAQVQTWNLKRISSGSGRNHTTTEKLVVLYRYRYQGKSYTNDRLDLSLGSDNFSGQRRAEQLARLRQPQVSVWVNPNNPQQSLLDRSLPAAQVSFLILFLFLPCGLGTICIFSGFIKVWNYFSGRDHDRFLIPLWGSFHGAVTFYPLLFAFQDLSFMQLLILIPFALMGGWCLTELIRRLGDPARGAELQHHWREQLLPHRRR